MDNRNSDNIFDELNKLVEDNKDIFEEAAKEIEKIADDISIKDAIKSDDPLNQIYSKIKGINESQSNFILCYESILTINSSGLSGLWDKHDFADVVKLGEFLKEIGAQKMSSAIFVSHNFIVENIGNTPDEDELFELICDGDFEDFIRQYYEKNKEFIEEIELKLLEYAKNNISSLEGRP